MAADAPTTPAPAPEPATVAVAAPAATPAASGAAAVSQQHCHREPLIGTNRFTTICDQGDLDRQKGLDTIGRLTGPQAAFPSAFH